MSDEMTQRILRAMAWERAKGELNSILSTYIRDVNSSSDQFAKMLELVDKFTKEVENEGLAE